MNPNSIHTAQITQSPDKGNPPPSILKTLRLNWIKKKSSVEIVNMIKTIHHLICGWCIY